MNIPQMDRKAFADLTNDKRNALLDKSFKVKDVKKVIDKRPPGLQVKDPFVKKENKVLRESKLSNQKDGILTEESCQTLISDKTFDDSKLRLESTEIKISADLEKKSSETVKYDDVDKENIGDVTQTALYAHDIFEYFKQRERKFAITPYMGHQKDLSVAMRAILIDWLVEIQENFELNHETLYLAVKIVDMYLSKREVSKDILQLIGAVSLFISCKFDERCPPLIQDFLYICDDAYKRQQFIRMEINILKTIDFDLGIPISYRFLRRYAKCARVSTEVLTLCRYILELSLMDYSFITVRDSKMAAASLLLGIKMRAKLDWTPTLVYYTGYKKQDLTSLSCTLNKMVKNASSSQQTIVYEKYSHAIFHSVALHPTISDADICS